MHSWLSKILLGSGLLLLSVDIAAAQATPSDLTHAEQLVREGKYQEAYDLLAPQETSLSADATFNYLLGRAALGIGKADKAKDLFERSIELRQGWIAPHLGLGRAYFAL